MKEEFKFPKYLTIWSRIYWDSYNFRTSTEKELGNWKDWTLWMMSKNVERVTLGFSLSPKRTAFGWLDGFGLTKFTGMVE